MSQLVECYTEMVRMEESENDMSVLKDNIDADSLPCMSHCYFCECTVDVKPSPNLININPEF